MKKLVPVVSGVVALVALAADPAANCHGADLPPTRESALAWLVANARYSTDVPSDLSHQHDHYLYGLPKRDV